MNELELVSKRRSVRTFDGRTLSEDDQSRILDAAGHACNPYGLPISWKILSAKESRLKVPVISGADTYIAGKMTLEAHAEEAFGYAFEEIVLFAQSLGIGTTWIAGTMDRAAVERTMDLGPGEVLPCISPLGYPAGRMSFRETMMRKGVRADSRMAFEELFFDGSFDCPLSRDRAGALSVPLEMVRLGPSAVNKQPWRILIDGKAAHFYEKQNPGYAKDGWDIQKIDLGIAMNHFDRGIRAEGLSGSFTEEDPGIQPPEGVRYITTCIMN